MGDLLGGSLGYTSVQVINVESIYHHIFHRQSLGHLTGTRLRRGWRQSGRQGLLRGKTDRKCCHDKDDEDMAKNSKIRHYIPHVMF